MRRARKRRHAVEKERDQKGSTVKDLRKKETELGERSGWEVFQTAAGTELTSSKEDHILQVGKNFSVRRKGRGTLFLNCENNGVVVAAESNTLARKPWARRGALAEKPDG